MPQPLHASLKTLALLAATTMSLAAHAQANTGWTGTWKGAQGALMSAVESGGSIDVWGKDEASIYRLSCVVDRKDASQASCVGEGMNHVRGTRFTYRSKLKLSGGTLAEQWEAQEFLGTAEGRETFTRVATVK